MNIFSLYITLFFENLGVHLPFLDFHIDVVNFLGVCPLWLTPNAWAFVIAFEHMCERECANCIHRVFSFFSPPQTKLGMMIKKTYYFRDMKL